VKAKALPLLKDNAYAPALKAALAEKLADPAFDEKAVEAFVAKKCEEYDLVAGKSKAKGKAKEAAPQRPANGFNPAAGEMNDEELDALDNTNVNVESHDDDELVAAPELNWGRPAVTEKTATESDDE
jgi:hypothetical protein